MQIDVDFKKYAENVLKKMKKQLKNTKDEHEKDILKKDIEKHKEKYSDYLN